jgi:hypothetical protein
MSTLKETKRLIVDLEEIMNFLRGGYSVLPRADKPGLSVSIVDAPRRGGSSVKSLAFEWAEEREVYQNLWRLNGLWRASDLCEECRKDMNPKQGK